MPDAHPLSAQPEMSTGCEDRLRNSMNSSFPPAGPRVRNSEMTMSPGGADCAAAGAAVAKSATSVTRTGRPRERMRGTIAPIEFDWLRKGYPVVTDSLPPVRTGRFRRQERHVARYAWPAGVGAAGVAWYAADSLRHRRESGHGYRLRGEVDVARAQLPARGRVDHGRSGLATGTTPTS